MADRFTDKVVLITGAARGQGRAHALRFAAEGATVYALDAAAQIDSVEYPLASPEDLNALAADAKGLAGTVHALQVDVRDRAALDSVVATAMKEHGRIDVVVPNAGVFSKGHVRELSAEAWRDHVDVNLTGVWDTVQAALPAMVDNGGSIVLIGSTGAVLGHQNFAHYISTKHAVVGLMKALANELAQYGIRVNTVHPGPTATGMILNEPGFKLIRPDLENPQLEDVLPVYQDMGLLKKGLIDPDDIANAVLWLSSDEARFVTGTELKVDSGVITKA